MRQRILHKTPQVAPKKATSKYIDKFPWVLYSSANYDHWLIWSSQYVQSSKLQNPSNQVYVKFPEVLGNQIHMLARTYSTKNNINWHE